MATGITIPSIWIPDLLRAIEFKLEIGNVAQWWLDHDGESVVDYEHEHTADSEGDMQVHPANNRNWAKPAKRLGRTPL